MILPTEFKESIITILGDEANDFFEALTEKVKVSGLRCNTSKVEPKELESLLGMSLKPVDWCNTGFTYSSERPSKNPLYQAGLYYLQEPSAMAPVVLLDAKPGDKVLDLCAAPGGKSTQIAAQLQGKGLLVANDASASRSRALVKNLTLCGARNAIILKETPKRLARHFEGYFDKILVDAPCSGEGMFRKDPEAMKAWTANKPEQCVALQEEILRYAAGMLKPGGRLVYSTCTFNLLENEGQIAKFIEKNPNFVVEKSKRLWPHKVVGEGHFVCVLKKNGEVKEGEEVSKSQPLSKLERELFNEFCQGNLKAQIDGHIFSHGLGSAVFATPVYVDLSGLRVARSGWYLGEMKKDRFEPSHAMALGLKADEAQAVYELSPEECGRYLRGESLEVVLPFSNKAWVLMCIAGYPLGWARLVNGRLKNKYPQGWVANSGTIF